MLLLLVMVLIAGVVPAASAGLPVPPVFPTPQSVRSRPEVVRIPDTVTVVARGDESAVAVVRQTLADAGARTIHQVTEDDGRAALTVYLGKHEKPLRALGVRGPDGIAAEGYVLAAGDRRIVLAGVDPAGTFYAAQTFRQLVRARSVPGTEIRDWPSLRWRGVVEGFYGPPWSHEVRLADLDYYGRHKMNAYVYTPKDDAYLRAEWRKPYPADALARLGELVTRAKANHVEFHYVLSPGLSVCYSRPAEAQALAAKFGTLRSIGVRSFVVAFDDIDHQRWNCAEDEAAFGIGSAAAATAQARLTNAVRDHVERLQLVPTEYWGTAKTGYTDKIAELLASDVVVQWTGNDVIAGTITRADVHAAADNLRHPLLIWDNYPVNDYVPQRLLLGPLVGREPGLGASAIGLTANPMPQAHASKTSLFTVADYAWNDTAYDAERSWTAGLRGIAAGEPRTFAALRAFADQNHSSRLDSRSAPRLSEHITRFWRTGRAGDLRPALAEVRDSPAVLRAGLGDPGFLADCAPWLDATAAWGRAAVTALDMLTVQRSGAGERTWSLRQELSAQLAGARQIPAEVDSAMERFIISAIAENGRWFGLASTTVTNLPSFDDRFPITAMTDGEPQTYFWGAASAQPGHHVGIDLGRVRPVSRVDVLMGKGDRPDDYLHAGIVEHSLDGTTWTTGPEFSGTAELHVRLPAGTTARFVRLRATQPQPNWVVVREFSAPAAEVSGAPEIADDNLTTAARPTGGEVVITWPEGHPVLLLVQGNAEVRIRRDGRWVRAGKLSPSGYSSLPKTDGIKLTWRESPLITEVLQRVG